MEDTKDKSDYQCLMDMLEEFTLEKEKIENEISCNQDSIKEIDLYMKSLFEKEDVDYEVFSPRNVQSIYKDKIDAQTNDKNILQKKNKQLFLKLDKIQNRISNLNQICEHIHEKNDEEEINQNISTVIMDIQEKERQRIARDLHDNTVQNLTHLIHKIELSTKFMSQDVVRAKMELIDINRNIKDIINDMRNIIFNLRPMEFDDIGLKTTFEKLMIDTTYQSNIEIEYDIDDITLNNELSDISMYHIIKECINNSVKHSNAKKIIVYIKNINNSIKISVQDDGIGFDINKVNDKRHFGLSLLKESVSILNGQISIESIINKGTTINICIPLTNVKGVIND